MKCKSVFRIQELSADSVDRPSRTSPASTNTPSTRKPTVQTSGTVPKPTPSPIKPNLNTNPNLVAKSAIIVDESIDSHLDSIKDAATTNPTKAPTDSSKTPASETLSNKSSPHTLRAVTPPLTNSSTNTVPGALTDKQSNTKPKLVPKPAIIIEDSKPKLTPAPAIILDDSSASNGQVDVIDVETDIASSSRKPISTQKPAFDRESTVASTKPRTSTAPSAKELSITPAASTATLAIPSKGASPSTPAISSTSQPAVALDKWRDYPTNQKMSIIMQGFRADFNRPKTSTAYRMGLAGATFVMMLLPILYAAFIAGTAYLVYLHVANNFSIVTSVRGKAAIFAILIYLAPVVAGVLAIVFMLKPIFASGFKRSSTRSLTEEREPILFDFVRRICSEVGAPFPKRIDVDNEVNASASFRSGWWSILRGNDLVLTIGMPLVAGLNLQQLAGVLAHEFGHFSQGAGMRVSYILRTVNHWFVRAVYERDSWDEWLETMSKTLDIRIAWIFYFARFAVWFSRRFLWCLMSLGGLLTGIMQQQMEYDADRYEVAMSGKKTFAKTFNSLGRTAIAYQQSLDTLARILDEGKIVSNLPLLTKANLTKIKPESLKYLDEKLLHERTRRFDTHPCDRDRINAVSSQPDDGAYQTDLPARCVFLNYDAECIAVTKEMMVSILGKEALQKKVVDIKTVIAEDEEEAKAWDGLHRFFCDCITTNRAFFLPHYQLARVTDSTKALDLLKRARQATLQYRPHYSSVMTLEEQSNLQQQNSNFVYRLKLKYRSINNSLLRKIDSKVAPEIASPDHTQADLFVKACVTRMHTACSMLQDANTSPLVPDRDRIFQRVLKVLASLKEIDKQHPKILELEEMLYYQIFCVQHVDSNKDDQHGLYAEITQSSEQLIMQLHILRDNLMMVPYPFDHADANMTVGAVLIPTVPAADDVIATLQTAETVLNSYHNIRGRCLGHLSIAAETVEKSLGLNPLEFPKK